MFAVAPIVLRGLENMELKPDIFYPLADEELVSNEFRLRPN